MAGRRIHRAPRGLALATALVTAAALTHAAPAPPPPPPSARVPQRNPADELAAGRMLVAARSLVDRNFAESVVLLFSYSKYGAAGVIVNRRTTVPVQQVLPDLPAPKGPVSTVFLGGPVATTDVRGLVRAPVAPADAYRVLKDVHLLGTPQALDDAVAAGVAPERLRLYLGYAGWGAGQLEREVRHGDWYVVAGDGDVVFDARPETLWRRELRVADVLAV